MIELFVTVTLQILYFLTQSLPVQCSEGTTDVHKYTPQTLDGPELSLWHPERKKHKTLSLLFARDCGPPACICNNSKEMIHGEFHQQLKDVACHLKQLEP